MTEPVDGVVRTADFPAVLGSAVNFEETKEGGRDDSSAAQGSRQQRAGDDPADHHPGGTDRHLLADNAIVGSAELSGNGPAAAVASTPQERGIPRGSSSSAATDVHAIASVDTHDEHTSPDSTSRDGSEMAAAPLAMQADLFPEDKSGGAMASRRAVHAAGRGSPEQDAALANALGIAGTDLVGPHAAGPFREGPSTAVDRDGRQPASPSADPSRGSVRVCGVASAPPSLPASQEGVTRDPATTAATPFPAASDDSDRATSEAEIADMVADLPGPSAKDVITDAARQQPLRAAGQASANDPVRGLLQSASQDNQSHSAIASIALAADAPLPQASMVAAGSPGDAFPASTSSNPSLANLADHLFSHVAASADNGGRELVLQLHPPELGDLTIRVLVNGREVAAWFASPQIQVQQAISQAIGQLQADLANIGYSLAGAWVGADSGSPQESDGRAPALAPSRGAHNRLSRAAVTDPASRAPAPGVSIYV